MQDRPTTPWMAAHGAESCPPEPIHPLLSLDEAAALLAIDADDCRRLCVEGLQREGEWIRLPHVLQGRELRIDPTDLHEFTLRLAGAGAAARTEAAA